MPEQAFATMDVFAAAAADDLLTHQPVGESRQVKMLHTIKSHQMPEKQRTSREVLFGQNQS